MRHLIYVIGALLAWALSSGSALAAPLPITMDAPGPGSLTSRWLVGQSEGFFVLGANATPANRLLSGTTVVAIDDFANISGGAQICASLPCNGSNPTVARVFDADGQVNVSVDGKSVTSDAQSILGLSVTHTYTVIDGPGVARALLKLHNPTANAIPVAVSNFFNLSFQDTIVASSSGDAIFSAADRWLIARRNVVTVPATTVDTMVFFGPGTPAVTPSSVSKGADIYQASFATQVPAGATIYFMWFLAMYPDQAGAQAAVGLFDDVSPATVLVADLTPEQRSNIVNWDFPDVPVVTANAGPDQTVDEATPVALDGAASAGGALTNSWMQLAGPTVVLAGADTAVPTFTAPLLAGGFGAQTLTFQLTVAGSGQSASDTIDITIRNVNHAPVADAGGDQTVNEGSVVALSGDASFDPESDPVAYGWMQVGGPAVTLNGATTATPTFTAPLLGGGVGGVTALTFELTVSDGVLSHTDMVTVTVEQVNHAPVADAGSAQTVHSGTPVTLNGTASGDPDGDPLGFSWIQVAGPLVSLVNADSAAPSFTSPLLGGSATLTFRLIVSDGLLAGEADVNVTVTNGVPRCDLGVSSPNLLWPPNHTMRAVSIVKVTDPNDEAVVITVTGVTQDEPVDGLGDGDTSPDAIVQNDGVLIRAERAGDRNGRVYTIMFSADDGAGGVCSGAAIVTVPKSMKPGMAAVDDGQLYDSTMP